MTTIEHLYRTDYSPQTNTLDGRWIPARPYNGFVGVGRFARLKDAWAVFRGRAEAVSWPEQRPAEVTGPWHDPYAEGRQSKPAEGGTDGDSTRLDERSS